MSVFFKRAEPRSSNWFATGGVGAPGRVTPERAAYLGPVFSAIRHIVDFGSTLPLDAYRVDANGSRVKSPLPLLLRRLYSPGYYGPGQWIGQALYGLVTVGNAVGWINDWDGFGYPTDVAWLASDEWTLEGSQWRVNGRPVSASRIFHIPWIVPPGKTLGMSPIEHYAATVRAGLSAQEYADLKRGGGLPPAVLKNTQKTLDPDQSERVREKAVQSFASGKPFVTGYDWDLSVVSIPPNQAQFIETLKLSANQIAAIYGIDPREIGGEAAGSLTYSTDESRSLNRANNMRPYLVRVEQAINMRLPDRQFVKLNVDATIRTDIKTRVEVLGAQIQDGRLSVNEARALEDRPAVSGGDYYNVPRQQAPAVPSQRQGDTP